MIGEHMIRVDDCESTNDLALFDGQHGTVVIADFQSAGRGQYGRAWSSLPGDSLLMSVVVKPPQELKRPSILIAWAAVAVADLVSEFTKQSTRIKWPNDILVREKKICGILTESNNDCTVVGVGLNLNQSQAFFDQLGLPQATSMSIIRGLVFDRETIVRDLCERFNASWQYLVNGYVTPLESVWSERVGLIGWAVKIQRFDGKTHVGRLVGMSFDGIEIVNDQGSIDIIPPESIRSLSELA